MTPNEQRVPWMSAVTLNPKIVYGGDKRPTLEEEARMHHQAHEQCYISQSVKTKVTVAGMPEVKET
jgi:organic hydroperoxide reductase OsmC/OhrA